MRIKLTPKSRLSVAPTSYDRVTVTLVHKDSHGVVPKGKVNAYIRLTAETALDASIDALDVASKRGGKLTVTFDAPKDGKAQAVVLTGDALTAYGTALADAASECMATA